MTAAAQTPSPAAGPATRSGGALRAARAVGGRLRRGAQARVRLLLALGLVVGGAVALALGWYGVSGQALVARQLPYLVSGGLLGVALVILAAVLLGADIVQRELGRLERVERLVDELHAALLRELEPAPGSARGDADALPAPVALVAVPAGVTYHRPECALVAGKPAVSAVDAATRAARGLRPCRVCRPDDGGSDPAAADTAVTAAIHPA